MAQNKILVSFSKKNTDVFELLDEKKKDGVIISDYICECIRYYEKKHKETNKESVEETVKKVIANMFVNGSMPIATISSTNNQEVVQNEEEKIEENKQEGYAALEDMTNNVMSFINFDDD